MNVWQEKLSLLKYRGGLKAALFWLVKILFKAEVYFFYSINLSQQFQDPTWHSGDYKDEGSGLQFMSLNTPEDLARYPHELIERINQQSGWGVSKLIYENTGVYALLRRGKIVSQANISRNALVRVNSPIDLNIYLRPEDVFLGYLYTYPEFRGLNAASVLMRKIYQDLKKRNDYLRVIAHIRSTNVSSINTFRKNGWQKIGWIIIGAQKRLLCTYFPGRHKISVSEKSDLD